jgi:hypothetical protein
MHTAMHTVDPCRRARLEMQVEQTHPTPMGPYNGSCAQSSERPAVPVATVAAERASM